MSAEEIAAVVADLRAGRFRVPSHMMGALDAHAEGMRYLSEEVIRDSRQGPIVDATALYHSLVEHSRGIAIYEDHPNIAPPWRFSSVCYQNEHGNVIVMLSGGYEADEDGGKPLRDAKEWSETPDGPTAGATFGRWRRGLDDRWESQNEVDWDRVRWVVDTVLFIGGRGGHGPFPTTGPMHMWRFAVYEDGAPADLHWMQLVEDYPMAHWDMAHLVILGTLNFMNCRNVEIIEPRRPRHVQRRLHRVGVRVSEINVFPVGRSARRRGETATGGAPLTSVRGHFAHYGACCAHHEPRGFLFGKLQGRYWIPQHARGSAEHGEIEQHVTLHEEETTP